MKKYAILGFVIASVLSATMASELRLNGSTTVLSNVIVKIKDPFKAATGIDLVVKGSGSGAGFKDLLTGGLCDMAMASDTMEDLSKGLTINVKLKDYEIARDTMKIIVNKKNSVTMLTRQQVKDINLGIIKNWKEVGGPDLDIIVVTATKSSGTRKFFQKFELDNEAFSPDAIEVETSLGEVKEVADMDGAIGAVSAGVVGNSVKTVEANDISRGLYLIVVNEPTVEGKKLLDYIKGDGAKYLK